MRSISSDKATPKCHKSGLLGYATTLLCVTNQTSFSGSPLSVDDKAPVVKKWSCLGGFSLALGSSTSQRTIPSSKKWVMLWRQRFGYFFIIIAGFRLLSRKKLTHFGCGGLGGKQKQHSFIVNEYNTEAQFCAYLWSLPPVWSARKASPWSVCRRLPLPAQNHANINRWVLRCVLRVINLSKG